LREGLFFAAGRFRSTLEVSWPSGRYVVATADLDVSRRTFVSGPYGLDRLLRAAELIERETGRGIRGRAVLEIGANIGTTTIPLLTVLGAAHVHAFEPVPRNYRLLEQNIRLNDLFRRATLYELAVSDQIGNVALAVSDRFWGSARVSGEGVHEARAVTLDALLSDGTLDAAQLALVWIDVEGHEAAVLAGATRLGKVPIVLEHDPAQQADLARLHELIASRKADLYDLASGALVELAELGDRATDVLVLPRPCATTDSPQ
jgi:FkbM family methyltransferase